MNADALVLAMVAVADLVLIFHLRQRRRRKRNTERVMSSLRMAVQRQNHVIELSGKQRLPRAS